MAEGNGQEDSDRGHGDDEQATSRSSEGSEAEARGIWPAISRRWGVTIVIASGIAVLLGVVGSALDLWDRFTSGEPAARVEEVTVTQQGTVELEYASFAEDEYEWRTSDPATLVTLSLNNPGSTAEAFFALEGTVLSATTLQDCTVAGGAIKVTGDYELPLPNARPGARNSIEIAWQVAGHKNDSFSVTLGNPNLTGLEQVPLYQLGLRLRKGDDTWLDAGTIVFANEFPHYGAFLNPANDVTGDCTPKNLNQLNGLLTKSGERSEALTLYTRVVNGIADEGSAYLGQFCPTSESQDISDIYPVDLVGDDNMSELAVVMRCMETPKLSDAQSQIVVLHPDSFEPLYTYKPVHDMQLADLSSVGNRLQVRYQTTQGTRVQGREDTLVVRGSKLVVLDSVNLSR